MQQYVFDQLGYTALAKNLRVPLVNLHSGELVDVKVPGGFVFQELTIHKSLVDVDLLCSVPMMKTHQLATVTLGMKNLVGAFPGTVYQSVRGHMHDVASTTEPTGASAVVVDMVRANKAGITPCSFADIEIRGEPFAKARRTFIKPQLVAWKDIRPFWGAREM